MWISRNKPAQVEEDYGNSTQDDRYDPEYWRVDLPSNELEHVMWGGHGVPAPDTSPTPDFQKRWAKREDPTDAVGANVETVKEVANVQNGDNISMAIDSSISSELDALTDEVILDDIVWKQRSGFGKYYMGILNHEWEQRRVTLFASGKLRYYAAKHAEHSSSWEFSSEQRGEVLLNSRIKVKARRRSDTPGPTPFEIDLIQRDTNEMWRFCFISQSVQAEWMTYFNQNTKPVEGEEDEYSDDSEDEDLDDPLNSLENHGLRPGDHIIRWEMLPIIYPIQIHGM